MRKLLLMMFVMLLYSGNALACGDEAKGQHTGFVQQTDVSNGTFILHDMAKQGPLEFTASPDLMQKIVLAKGMIVVNYQKTDSGLVAKGISH